MNLRWTLRRTSPAGIIMLLVGGLMLVSASQAPQTQDAAYDMPSLLFTPSTSATAPTTTVTLPSTTTTTAPAPIVYDPIPPGGRQNLGGDKHPMVPQPAFGMIVIPKINLVHPIFEGIDEPVIHWGPGHWPGSAVPGQSGNAVFAGHRVTHTRPFLDIDLLAPGDQIIFHLATGTYVYEVTEHIIVGPNDLWITNPTPTPTVTLFACHPKHSAQQRYVVKAKLISAGPYSPV